MKIINIIKGLVTLIGSIFLYNRLTTKSKKRNKLYQKNKVSFYIYILF